MEASSSQVLRLLRHVDRGYTIEDFGKYSSEPNKTSKKSFQPTNQSIFNANQNSTQHNTSPSSSYQSVLQTTPSGSQQHSFVAQQNQQVNNGNNSSSSNTPVTNSKS